MWTLPGAKAASNVFRICIGTDGKALPLTIMLDATGVAAFQDFRAVFRFCCPDAAEIRRPARSRWPRRGPL
jgi:hypothetical protein